LLVGLALVAGCGGGGSDTPDRHGLTATTVPGAVGAPDDDAGTSAPADPVGGEQPSASEEGAFEAEASGAGDVVDETGAVAAWTGPLHPLTGLPAVDGVSALPAIVVKVGNNNEGSLPQHGLASADIVYEIHIESGKTRFAAVFHSVLPEAVMPVRSARSSDLDLSAGLSQPVFAYWGANEGVLAEIRRAERRGHLEGRSTASVGQEHFVRDAERRAPYNGRIDPEAVLGTIGDRSADVAPVFAYGPAPAAAVPALGVRWTARNRVVDYVWDDDVERWMRYQDGLPHVDDTGAQLSTDNVVVLYVNYRRSDADPVSPQALTTGSGDGWVLRDGTVTGVVWSRPSATDGWNLTDDGTGEPVALDPGTAWVAVARLGEGSILGPDEVAPLTR